MENKEKLKELRKSLNCYKHYRRVAILKNVLRRTMKYGAPVLLPSVFVASAIGITGRVPGRNDYHKECAHTKTEYYSTTGDVRQDKQYSNFIDETDAIYYYGAWELQENGTYSRQTKVYELQNVDGETVLGLADKEKLQNTDVLGEVLFDNSIKSIKENTQILEHVIPEDLGLGSYYVMTVYDEDKNDVILVGQTEDEEITDRSVITGVPLAIGMCAGIPVALLWEPKYNYNYYDCEIENVKRKIKNTNSKK